MIIVKKVLGAVGIDLMIDELPAISEENAAMNEISNASKSLASLAEDMIGIIDKFKY